MIFFSFCITQEWDFELQDIAQRWANQCQYRGNDRYSSGPAVNDGCRDTSKLYLKSKQDSQHTVAKTFLMHSFVNIELYL